MSYESIVTVTTAAAGPELVSLDDARDELRDPPVTDNPFIRRAIKQSSQTIASYCGRVLAQESVTEEFRGRGPLLSPWTSAQYSGVTADADGVAGRSEWLYLRRYPITTVASIVEDDVTLVAGTDYEIDYANGRIRRMIDDLPRSWAYYVLVATYTGGYALADVPADLQQAALRMVTARYTSRGRDPALRSYDVPGVLSETFWVGAVGDNGAIPPDVAGVIDQYREARV